MNSQQYTGLQAAMPQGSGARVQVQGGEGTTFDVTSAVKGIQQLGGVVAKHIQSTQDANRQIDFTLMQSQNAIKDKEAQQVLATLDPETRKVTLPDGTQQDHNAYVDTYSQAKNQTVNDFRSKYNYGHYSNDKIDVATRSVLETSSDENTFIKQQNELQIAEGRLVNSLNLLANETGKSVTFKAGYDAAKSAIDSSPSPKKEKDQLLSQYVQKSATLMVSQRSIKDTKALEDRTNKYGANPEKFNEETLKYLQSPERLQYTQDINDALLYLQENPVLVSAASKTQQDFNVSTLQEVIKATSDVKVGQAAYQASLNAAAIQNASTVNDVAISNPDSLIITSALQGLKSVLNNPMSSKEDKFKAKEAEKGLLESQALGRKALKVGFLNLPLEDIRSAENYRAVASTQEAIKKQQVAAAEKAAKDAEKQQDKLARLFTPTPTMTNKTRAELEAQGVPVEVWEQMSGGIRWTDTELYQQVTINGLTSTAKQYAYGTPQFETVMKAYDSIHNFTKNESMSLTQLATTSNEAISMREAYALQSELLKNNKGYNDLKYGIVQQISADSRGLSAMGLNLPTLVDFATALVMEEKHLDGLSFGYDKNKGTTNLKQLGVDVTAKVKELGSNYKNKTLLSLDAKNYVAKNLSQYYMLPPAIKGVLIPQDYLYSDKAKQNAPVIATINAIGKTISSYGLPPLTISSPTRTKPRLDKNGKAIPTMHDERSIAKGVVAIDISANSDPVKAVDALLGGIGGMQAVGSNVEVRGGGRDFANAYSLWSHVKQHGDLPAQSAGRGYDHLTKVQRADLIIKLKSIKTFEDEGVNAENHLHFNCRVAPNKIWDNLPDETRKQAQNFSSRGGR
jgi:hypothetical protein